MNSDFRLVPFVNEIDSVIPNKNLDQFVIV